MATTKRQMALVLCDVPSIGAKAGQLIEAPPAVIKALEAEGSLDAHKEAVQAAKDRGADVFRAATTDQE